MKLIRLFLPLTLLILGGCAGHRQSEPPPVLLVSIDGFRADYLGRGLTPALSAIAAEGARAEAMRPSFPSLTFPNHYTLVTGLYPDHHGIVNNTMEDPSITPNPRFTLSDRAAVTDARWWDGATPIWVSAERQGVRTATMFWPGSETAIQGVRPSRWETFDPAVTPADRVDKVLGWLDLPAPERPRFLTLYFDQVDHAGHESGPESAGVNAALVEIDQAMARLVDGLKSRGLYAKANLVVVADHGMQETAPERVTYLDDLIDPQTVHIVTAGVLTSLSANAGRETEVETRLLGRHDHLACWRKGALPAYLHYGQNPRVPPILCLADPGWQMYTRQGEADFAAKGQTFSLGQHGYDPTGTTMAALFIAHGPAFRPGAVQKPFDNVDVYPLLARLLAIRPEPNDGRLDDLTGILQPGTS